MEMKIYKYGVVGTGPMAASVVQVLRENDEIPLVVDIGDTIEQSRPSAARIRSGLLKSHENNFYPYWIDNSYYRFSDEISGLYVSKAFGGYSKVWGSTLNVKPFGNPLFENFHTSSTTLREIESRVYKKIKLEPQFLAVSHDKCIGCGECLVGCIYGAIWDSSAYLKNLYHQEEILLMRDEVISIEQSDLDIFLIGNNSNYRVETLFLCAGVLGNLQIMSKSKLVAGEFYFSETRMFFGLAFDFKFRLPRRKFSLSTSQLNVSFANDILHIQLYEDMRGLSYRYFKKNQANRVYVKAAFSLAARFFTPFIGYLPSEESPRIRLVLQEKSGYVSESGKIRVSYKVRMYLKLFITFIKLRRVLIGVRFSSAGSGYHLGNLHGDATADFIRKHSKIPDGDNILILDSGMLEQFTPGAITLPAMDESRKRVKNYLANQRKDTK